MSKSPVGGNPHRHYTGMGFDFVEKLAETGKKESGDEKSREIGFTENGAETGKKESGDEKSKETKKRLTCFPKKKQIREADSVSVTLSDSEPSRMLSPSSPEGPRIDNYNNGKDLKAISCSGLNSNKVKGAASHGDGIKSKLKKVVTSPGVAETGSILPVSADKDNKKNDKVKDRPSWVLF